MDKYTAVKRTFEENQDQENAVKMAKYMRDLFVFYGIPTPKRKKLYRDFLKGEGKNKTIDWGFLDRCYEDEHREFQYLVADYLSALNSLLTFEDIPAIRKFIDRKQWWAIDHQLLRKDKTNTVLLEKIIVNNLGSDEFFINKAIGWSLRDYSKTNPEWVRNLIERYRNRMDKLSIREAGKYI